MIERERPDTVCLELDRQRYQALANPERWDALDVKQLIRDRQLAPLIANLMLAAYQRKLGGALGVKPGAELLEAGRAAEALGIPVCLCDRDVRVTLRRAWASLSLWKKSLLVSTFVASALERPELSEEDLRELRQQDVVSRMMAELAEFLPALKRVLIDERDRYLAQRIRETPGRRTLVVVGAGHVAGVLAALRESGPVDLAALDRIPPVSRLTKWLGWGIPAGIVAALVAVGITQGAEAAAKNLAFWVLVTGIPCTLGAAAAFAHPITIVAAFFTAPVTTLSPVIGAGHVVALVQAGYSRRGRGVRAARRGFHPPLAMVAKSLAARAARLHPDDARDHARDVRRRLGDRLEAARRTARMRGWRIALLCAAGALAACRHERPAFPDGRLVDLTHTFDADTIYWPSEPGFELERGVEGVTPQGWWYAAHRFRTAEHGGTHVDAPIHFAQAGASVDQVPLERLMAAAVRVDARDACARDRDHQIGPAELLAWERGHGPIPSGAIVLLQTGFGRFWPTARPTSPDERGAAAVAHLHFPGLHATPQWTRLGAADRGRWDR